MTPSLTILRKGLVLIAIPTLFQLVLLSLTAWMHEHNVEAQFWTDHSREVLACAREIRSDALRAYNSERGILLTGSSREQTQFIASEDKVRAGVKKLLALVQDDPEQAARATTIGVRAEAFLEWLEATRRLHQAGNKEEALARVQTLTGEKYLATLEEANDDFAAVEERLEKVRNERLRKSWQDLDGVILAGTIMTLLAMGIVAFVFSRGLSRRLSALAENARRLQTGTALTPALGGSDEVSELEAVFHEMARKLAAATRRDQLHLEELAKDLDYRKRLEAELQRTNQELDRQNREAQEANRRKSQFLANMSHELRTPLNSIIGFAELMHDGKVGPVADDHKDFLGDILTSARHLLTLINDILDLAKVEAGKMEFHPESVDLQALSAAALESLQTQADNKRIHLAADVDAGLGLLFIDPAKLKQVLYNYLSNALKFTPEGGNVTVRVRPEGTEFFRLEVEDTGVGIEPADAERLFSDFQQLGAARRHQGTGLGLSLTRQIVGAQGGRVGVNSKPGEGSIFFAVLPRTVSLSAQPQAQPMVLQPASVPGATILVVEDDADDRSWLAQVVTGAGYSVVTAANGTEAIALCRQRRFDAITLDLLLPDITGQEVLAAIRSAGPNHKVPVIIVTVMSRNYRTVAHSIQDFLTKPVRAEELLAALQRAGVPPGPTARILVVDDDPNALKIMDASLSGLGYQSICAANGAEGLKAAEENRPGAVILDLLMPGMDGFEFLERFRQTAEGRQAPVIVWTNKDLTGADRSRLRESAQGIVLKGEDGVAPLLRELQMHLRAPPA
jgi:signal transduction histidine kinase/DNA-binding response OmpR family regulator